MCHLYADYDIIVNVLGMCYLGSHLIRFRATGNGYDQSRLDIKMNTHAITY